MPFLGFDAEGPKNDAPCNVDDITHHRGGCRPTASTWRIADARNLLGAVLMAQDRLDEAGPLLSGTWEVIARQRGADSRYAREARERWRDWLEAVGGV